MGNASMRKRRKLERGVVPNGEEIRKYLP